MDIDSTSKNLPRVEAPQARNLLPGMDRKGIKADKHPAWYPPQTDVSSEASHPLHILNSFTEKLERFVPAAEASQQQDQASVDAPSKRRRVTWYTCGPTVYDVSHMGHARAYLTFDILRRVFEDYFGYEVIYQMNITDIDDKIIKRARIGKLLSNYKEAKLGWDQVVKEVDISTEFTAKALAERQEKLSQPLPANAQSRLVEEREEKIKELNLKLEQHASTKAGIEVAKASKNVDTLINAATSFLGDWLDADRGASITDNAIFDAHAKKYEKLYFEDMEALNIREPDVITRVSEVVPEVVTFVEGIIKNGFAYVADSSVLFDTQAYMKAGHDYPKLKPVADHLRTAGNNTTTEDEMAEGEGTLSMGNTSEKRSPNDFALWKFSKPGEPAWDSPWGKGRPGWHIECSVMASGCLGKSMDIHAGGCDLKFPHHDNELAQSEAFWGHDQWVNYFLHCGHLHIKGLKMSKSLKNFITIRQALDPEGELKVTSREMRLLFLMNDWHKPMNFSDQSVGASRECERTLRSFFGSVDIVLRGDWLKNAQTYTDLDKSLLDAYKKTTEEVHAALCNNIDTVAVMNSLMNLVAVSNKYLVSTQKDGAEQAPSATILKKVAAYITKMLRVFGVISSGDFIGFEEKGGAAGAANDVRLNTAMDALIGLRDEVRKATREKAQAVTLMTMCDKVRDEILPTAGIRLEDKPGGATTWKRDDPNVLLRERQERLAALAAERVKKLTNQIETQKKFVTKWEKIASPPDQYYQGDAAENVKYSKYDAAGVPTHDAQGAAIDEKKMGKLKQAIDKYAKEHEEFVKKGGSEFLSQEKQKLAQLQAELAQEAGAASS